MGSLGAGAGNQPSPTAAKLPFCFVSTSHHQLRQLQILSQQLQQPKDNNKLEFKARKQRVMSFIHCGGWQRSGVAPCIKPFEEISAFGFLVGKLPRNPGAAHGSRWLNSLVGMFTRSVRLSSSPRGVKAKGDKNAACRKWLQPLSPPLKAHQESITAASAPPERL